MKVVIATLIFISAAEAIRNLVGLPETRSTRLHHLLKGKYRSVIPDNSGLIVHKDDLCLSVKKKSIIYILRILRTTLVYTCLSIQTRI